ncbi:DUF4190 domain-containing protein [Micromonospora sp. CB01531]|uniref:DUF4190 domain-containing protein n=1 Tax=Micromonospora sp. CB01531 TaxID=1718947 RepID=UPI00093CE88C|nr:DUF4190 domain-containing protein [Micromonospora sp. CB01531]OKI54522.1 hypothetical protein A6A27_31855 [Micromonospora sp. CB01531]
MHPQTNSNAKAAYYLGLIGLIVGWCSLFIPNLIAIGFGHSALRTIRRTGEPGYSEARKGLTMAYLPMALVALGLTLAVINGEITF